MIEKFLNYGIENPEAFQSGWFLGLSFMIAFMLFSSVCDILVPLSRYLWEKVRALKIENDKKDPPKKLFSSLFKKNRENSEK